jgi:helicase
LSATIANAKEIGGELGLKPLIYKSRPVPVERHLVLCKSKVEKRLNLSYLVKKERKFGSTIVFTNSRYGTYQLSQYLRKQNLNLPAYHSGLSYYARKIIEKEIEFNQIDGVVSTFALGAGVDLPVSQVIFHSMRMGRDYLDNNMFLQMSGRAGRYKRHKRGKVVILAAVGNKFYGSDKTEDQIALQLLEGKEQNILTDYDPILVESQVLASMASGMNMVETEKSYDLLIGAEEDFNYLLKELVKKNMIKEKNNTFEISDFGRATAVSFFTTEQALEIKKKLNKKISILDIAIELEFFNNIYLDNRLKDELSRLLKVNLSSLFFTGNVFDLFSDLKKITGKIPDRIIETIITWQKNFSCDHDERPYCDCGLLKANLEIIDLRMSGFKPSQISHHFKRKYDLVIYPGDIFKMLDGLIHRLRGIRRIASSLELEKSSKKAQELIRKIENP